jgi:hypothetical protein
MPTGAWYQNTMILHRAWQVAPMLQNQLILAARIRNMCESKAKLLTIEEAATPLNLPSSGGGGIMSGAGTTLRHRRKPAFPADIFRFFCLSIDRRLPRRLCEHISQRTNEAR